MLWADSDYYSLPKYFEYNNSHLIKLDYSLNNELTATERAVIFPSIMAFQIGEGSEGKHLLKTVKAFAAEKNYSAYPEIMRWFILEENRHSQMLKRYMEAYDVKPVKELWIDNAFRHLRKLTGLECEVIVLVTAEMIALSYYDALSEATNSKLLKNICSQMLRDELMHIVLQSDTLNRISAERSDFINKLVRLIRKLIMSVTSSIVRFKYKALFIKGGYTYKGFKGNCRFYLDESIFIERKGIFRKVKQSIR